MDEKLEFATNKILYNLIALFGFLFVFFAGLYWGYTFNENKEYFNSSVKEIKYVTYINEKYTYNIEPIQDNKYSNLSVEDKIYRRIYLYGVELARKINNVTILLTIIGVVLLEIGYRNSSKYKYSKPLRQRIKEFYKRLKNEEL